MNRVEQLLALVSQQLSTNNAMLLEVINAKSLLGEEECRIYLKEIQEQSDISTTLVKGEQ